MRADQFEFAARKLRQHLALRADDLAQMQHLAFDLHDLVEGVVRGVFEHQRFQFGDLQREFIQRRFVVLDQRREDRLRHAIRRARDQAGALQTPLLDLRHALEMHVVKRDEEIFPEKKIQLTRREHAIAPAVIHRVNHQKQVGRKAVLLLRIVLLDLRRRTHRHAVLDRQRMKMKHVLEEKFRLLGRGFFEVHPEEKIGVRQQCGHQKRFDVLRVQAALRGECK